MRFMILFAAAFFLTSCLGDSLLLAREVEKILVGTGTGTDDASLTPIVITTLFDLACFEFYLRWYAKLG